MQEKVVADTFYMRMNRAHRRADRCSRTAKVAFLLETFSFVSFFDVYQRKSPALQLGTRHLKEDQAPATPQGGEQT
jgi:hypothetical protein